MSTCLMCMKEVSLDKGYVTDGLIYVCRDCAEKNSLMRIATRIVNVNPMSYIGYKWEPPIVQVSAPDDTSEPVSPVSDTDIDIDIDTLSTEDFLSKYADNPNAISRLMDMRPDECANYA